MEFEFNSPIRLNVFQASGNLQRLTLSTKYMDNLFCFQDRVCMSIMDDQQT